MTANTSINKLPPIKHITVNLRVNHQSKSLARTASHHIGVAMIAMMVIIMQKTFEKLVCEFSFSMWNQNIDGLLKQSNSIDKPIFYELIYNNENIL